jgi:hypothetical protein
MGAPHCGAALAALTLLLIFACGSLAQCRLVSPYPGHPHKWPTMAADYYRHRAGAEARDLASDPARDLASDPASDPASDQRTYADVRALASAPPDMRWWRWPGYAAPLELSLPLYNFQEYLYGYPPVSRLPYNA